MSRPPSRRKCRCCSKFFIPDKRTVDRQKYCSEAACRKASKAASQQRWLSQDGNGDYFRGPEQVQRVQRWREANPGYSKRKSPASQTIQPVESQTVKFVHSSCNAPPPLPTALQEDWFTQTPAFVGLIAMVTGMTLQEDIAVTTRKLLLRGQNILGLAMTAAPTSRPGLEHEPQTPFAARTGAPNTTGFQLGGPPIGPP